MRRHGRIPMSFSHGGFDDDYLEAVVLDADGRPRFEEVSFAVHVDRTMRGRPGTPRPRSEAELHPERARIAAMFARLRERHGVRSYLAHNMTVTPDNVEELGEVVRVCRTLGYRMCSFQPAAYVGDGRRWGDGYGELTADRVWREIERGVGRRLPSGALQVGDERCTRTTWGVWAGRRYVPVFDDRDPRDLRARDAYLRAIPANLRTDPWWGKLARGSRSLARYPADAGVLARWACRFSGRVAVGAALGAFGEDREMSVLPVTYVMHRFMDGGDVRRAWTSMQQGGPRRTRSRGRAGATPGVRVRDGAPGVRSGRAGLRPTQRPRPGRERTADPTPPARPAVGEWRRERRDEAAPLTVTVHARPRSPRHA